MSLKKFISESGSKGLPGGPNEMKFSVEGYKSTSPDRNNPHNIINSGNITMKGVPHPVFGQDNLGNGQMMHPGQDYQFPGNQVFETPIKDDYEDVELTEEEIQAYRDGGYVVDELPQAQDGVFNRDVEKHVKTADGVKTGYKDINKKGFFGNPIHKRVEWDEYGDKHVVMERGAINPENPFSFFNRTVTKTYDEDDDRSSTSKNVHRTNLLGNQFSKEKIVDYFSGTPESINISKSKLTDDKLKRTTAEWYPRKWGNDEQGYKRGTRHTKDVDTFDQLRDGGYVVEELSEAQDGKHVSPLEGDLIAKVLMQRNKDLNFVDRAFNPGDYPDVQTNTLPGYEDVDERERSTHLMAWGEDDKGQAIMYPSLVYNRATGELEPKSEGAPQEFIKVPNQYADYISNQGYKNATGMQDGGEYKDMDLTEDQIAEYRAGGYVVEEYQEGGEEEFDANYDASGNWIGEDTMPAEFKGYIDLDGAPLEYEAPPEKKVYGDLGYDPNATYIRTAEGKSKQVYKDSDEYKDYLAHPERAKTQMVRMPDGSTKNLDIYSDEYKQYYENKQLALTARDWTPGRDFKETGATGEETDVLSPQYEFPALETLIVDSADKADDPDMFPYWHTLTPSERKDLLEGRGDILHRDYLKRKAMYAPGEWMAEGKELMMQSTVYPVLGALQGIGQTFSLPGAAVAETIAALKGEPYNYKNILPSGTLGESTQRTGADILLSEDAPWYEKLGVDLLTDPLTYFGAGAATKGLKATKFATPQSILKKSLFSNKKLGTVLDRWGVKSADELAKFISKEKKALPGPSISNSENAERQLIKDRLMAKYAGSANKPSVVSDELKAGSPQFKDLYNKRVASDFDIPNPLAKAILSANPDDMGRAVGESISPVGPLGQGEFNFTGGAGKAWMDTAKILAEIGEQPLLTQPRNFPTKKESFLWDTMRKHWNPETKDVDVSALVKELQAVGMTPDESLKLTLKRLMDEFSGKPGVYGKFEDLLAKTESSMPGGLVSSEKTNALKDLLKESPDAMLLPSSPRVKLLQDKYQKLLKMKEEGFGGTDAALKKVEEQMAAIPKDPSELKKFTEPFTGAEAFKNIPLNSPSSKSVSDNVDVYNKNYILNRLSQEVGSNKLLHYPNIGGNKNFPTAFKEKYPEQVEQRQMDTWDKNVPLEQQNKLAQQQAFDRGTAIAEAWAIRDPEMLTSAKKAITTLEGIRDKKWEQWKKIQSDTETDDALREFKNYYDDEVAKFHTRYKTDAEQDKAWPAYLDSIDEHVKQNPHLKEAQERLYDWLTDKEGIDNNIKDLENSLGSYMDPEFMKKVVSIQEATGVKPKMNFSNVTKGGKTLKDRAKLVSVDEEDPVFKALPKVEQEYIKKKYNEIGGVRFYDRTDGSGNTVTLSDKPVSKGTYIKHGPTKYEVVEKEIPAPKAKLTEPKTWKHLFAKPTTKGELKFIHAPLSESTLYEVIEKKFMSPERILGTAAHETGHDLQRIDDWINALDEYNPKYKYTTAKGEFHLQGEGSPLNKEFKEAMVEPKIESEAEGYDYQTWLSGVGELHAELMKARAKYVSSMMDNDWGMDAAIQKLKGLEKEGDESLFSWYIEGGGNLNKHFKNTTSYDVKKKLVKILPAVIGVGLFGASAQESEPTNKKMDWQNSVGKHKQQDGGAIEMDLNPKEIAWYRSRGYVVEEM